MRERPFFLPLRARTADSHVRREACPRPCSTRKRSPKPLSHAVTRRVDACSRQFARQRPAVGSLLLRARVRRRGGRREQVRSGPAVQTPL
jgi:hypothetical protein